MTGRGDQDGLAAPPTVLVVGGEAGAADVLRQSGFAVVDADTVEQGLAQLATDRCDLLVTALRLAGGSGLDLLREVRRRGHAIPTVVVASDGSIEDAVTAMKLGAIDFLAGPSSVPALVALAAGVGSRSAAPPAREGTTPRLGAADVSGLTVREMEQRLIVDTLRRTANNRTQAARLLGISIRTLRNKLAEYRARGVLPLASEPRT